MPLGGNSREDDGKTAESKMNKCCETYGGSALREGKRRSGRPYLSPRPLPHPPSPCKAFASWMCALGRPGEGTVLESSTQASTIEWPGWMDGWTRDWADQQEGASSESASSRSSSSNLGIRKNSRGRNRESGLDQGSLWLASAPL
jgi:hypothetical protein